MLNRIIGLFITILIFVIVGEIVYLYISKPVEPTNNVIPKTAISTSPTSNNDQALSQSLTSYMNRYSVFKKGNLTAMNILYTLEGKIVKIGYPSTIPDKDDIFASIAIEGKEGLKNTLNYDKTILQVLQLYQKDNKTQSPIKFENLKLGDNVKIEYNVNMYTYSGKQEPIESVIITKQ